MGSQNYEHQAETRVQVSWTLFQSPFTSRQGLPRYCMYIVGTNKIMLPPNKV